MSTQDEQLLQENLGAILDGTFQAGLGLLKVGAALKTSGKVPGWKMRAIAAYLEKNQGAAELLISALGAGALDRMKRALNR
jgi:hypothetical protein